MRGSVLVIPLLSLSVLSAESASFGALQDEAAQTTEKKTPTKPSPESPAQVPLTNDSIVKLVKQGLREDSIINLINTRPEQFSFAASAVAALQKAGVSEKIISAMVNRDLRGPTAAMAEPKPQRQSQTTDATAGESNPATVTQAAQPPPARESLTNDSIIKMVQAGLSEAVILSMVTTQPGKYSLGADEIIALKKAGVSDNIIKAIVNKSASGSGPAPVSPDPAMYRHPPCPAYKSDMQLKLFETDVPSLKAVISLYSSVTCQSEPGRSLSLLHDAYLEIDARMPRAFAWYLEPLLLCRQFLAFLVGAPVYPSMLRVQAGEGDIKVYRPPRCQGQC